MTEKMISMPLGVVVRRTKGATRWAKWAWRAVAVLPGAGPADWKEMRREGEAVEFHAGTLPLELHRTDTEAYLTALSMTPPTVWAVLREEVGAENGVILVSVTASAFEAQDHTDGGEDLVEPVPMPPGLVAWVRDFVEQHHVDEAFVKRRRTGQDTEDQDGRGDRRIRQAADVYRSPSSMKTGQK